MAGMPKFLLEEVIAHFDYWRSGVGAEIASHVADLVGRPPRTFEAFAHDYADAFRRPGRDRFLRDLLPPVVFRFLVTDRSLAWMYDHHIDWGHPIRQSDPALP
jgi:hypothetical protein